MTAKILALISMFIILIALIVIVMMTGKARRSINLQAESIAKNSGQPLDDEAKQRLHDKYRARAGTAYKTGIFIAAIGLILGVVAIIIKYTA